MLNSPKYIKTVTMNYIYSLLACVLFFKSIESENILTLLAQPSKSHHVMFERIMKELAKRGHDIDFVSHFPLKTPIPGYNDLSLKGSQKILVNNLTLNDVTFNNHFGLLDFMFIDNGVKVCKSAFETKLLHDLKNTKKKYDLIITEAFTSDCMMGFAHIFNTPMISLTTSVALPWENDRLGNPDNPSYIPSYFVDFSSRMTVYERLVNTVQLVYDKIDHYFRCTKPSDKLAKEFFGPDLPDLQELMYRTSLILVNSHFSTNQARPTVPGFIEIGGVHINEPKPLSKHFQEIMKTDTKGIIYLSMGSMVRTETFPKEKIQALFDALSELPYKVVWKAEIDKFPSGVRIPKNIHFENWMPQLDILCSPNVKLFISHGGLMGSQEAVYCGVPRLGIPLFADQELNIRQAEHMGQALKLSFNDITKDTVSSALKELLYNKKYSENAKQFSTIFKDRPMSPIDTAIYWIEYVIRHKGAPHLRSVGAELAWYQYYLLDVGLILLTIVGISLYIIKKLLQTVFSLIVGRNNKKVTKKQKSK